MTSLSSSYSLSSLSLSLHQRPEEIIGLKDTEAAPCRYHAHSQQHWNALQLQLACHINSSSSSYHSLPLHFGSLSESLLNRIAYTVISILFWETNNDKLTRFFFLPSMARMSRSSWSSSTKRLSRSSSFSLQIKANVWRRDQSEPVVTCHQTCNHYFPIAPDTHNGSVVWGVGTWGSYGRNQNTVYSCCSGQRDGGAARNIGWASRDGKRTYNRNTGNERERERWRRKYSPLAGQEIQSSLCDGLEASAAAASHSECSTEREGR